MCDLNKSLPGGWAGFNHWFRDLSEPCKHPTQHPGVLLFSTCTRPTGCPAAPLVSTGRAETLSRPRPRSLFPKPLFPDPSYPDLAQRKKRSSVKACLNGTMVMPLRAAGLQLRKAEGQGKEEKSGKQETHTG